MQYGQTKENLECTGVKIQRIHCNFVYISVEDYAPFIIAAEMTTKCQVTYEKNYRYF
jgi:hypothetical protein